MKKTIIAGASAVAMAALPMAGVFAATQTSVVDTVTLTVNKTCQMAAGAATGSYSLGQAAAGGEYTAVTGTPITITCNGTNGWEFNAATTSMTGGTGTTAIPFGPYATSGSVWSAAVAVSQGSATIETGWDNYGGSALATATKIVSGAQADGLTITPSYKAKTSATQENGTYSGTITYTFTDKTPSN